MYLDVTFFSYGVGLVIAGYVAGMVVGFAYSLLQKLSSF